MRRGLSHQTHGDLLDEMSVRVDVPPYRQMVYSSNGGSRLMGPTKQLSKDGKTPATMMGPLGIEKRDVCPLDPEPEPNDDRPTLLVSPQICICQTLTDDLPRLSVFQPTSPTAASASAAGSSP